MANGILPDLFFLMELYVEGTVETVTSQVNLQVSDQEHTKLFGDKWVSELRTAILEFPSRVGGRSSYMLNLSHPDLVVKLNEAIHVKDFHLGA